MNLSPLPAAAEAPPQAAVEGRWTVGLDLGQSADYSSVAVLERIPGPDELAEDPASIPLYRAPNGCMIPIRDPKKKPRLDTFHVRHLGRWVLGTPYPQVIDDVKAMTLRSELAGGVSLVMDETGCGRPVLDLARERGLKPIGMTISAGYIVTRDANGVNVPKRDIVSNMVTLFQTRRLRIARELEFAEVLTKELLSFKIKVTAAGNDSFEAWRERDHDDLVLAVGIAAWFAAMRWRPSPGPSRFGTQSIWGTYA
jgi:hypothetical protein